jgi:hypothetical protein
VPDHLLALQRRARHLEQQLQELLDAQADGLMSGASGHDPEFDASFSNGSTTPTVSSVHDHDRDAQNGEAARTTTRKKKVNLRDARRGIYKRIQQLASVKAEELEVLDEDLRELQTTVEKVDRWAHKKSRLERKIREIKEEDAGARLQSLQTEASKLEQEIRLKEEELWTLKTRHRKVLNELADSENSVEARLSSYTSSLLIVEKEVGAFLSRVPDNHVPLSSSPFLTLSPKRRTLEMAQEYWREEHLRLEEKCEEVDMNRAALDEGAVLWNEVVKTVLNFETELQNHMQQADRKPNLDTSKLTKLMNTTIEYLEERLEVATSRSWNLLVCAIGAELEAFKQGQHMLEEALGISRKGKEPASLSLIDTNSTHTESEDEGSSSAIRITRSPPKTTPVSRPKFFDTDDEDPGAEFMISHQDTDTD